MIRRISVICITIALLFRLSVIGAGQSFPKPGHTVFADADAYLSEKMKELGIPGAALVIVEGDHIVHLKAFGVADADGRPVTPRTPFFTGSTGKSFTALAIMQLVEAHKIDLDAPVQAYLPWFRVADVNASRRITVRQLLNQTSGLPRSFGQEQLSNTDLSDSAIENYVRALAKIELNAEPGDRYEYSNANYVTLGMVIQAVSGQSYESYIREHIFIPLDMHHSFTSKTEAQQDGLAVGYQKWLGTPVASPNLPFARGSLPAGQLILSAEDFGHYLIAQLNEGNFQGISVLSPEGIGELHSPSVHMPDSTDYYAMGWEVQHFQDVEVIRHNGQVPGYTADMFLIPEKNIAVAMMMNTFSPMLGVRESSIPGNVLRILLDQPTIPRTEFVYMQVLYVLVMMLPFLQGISVLTTLRRVHFWRRNTQIPTRKQAAAFIALPLIWQAGIAYLLLVSLPAAFEADIPTVILFQPDVGWVALASGVFAIVWGFMRSMIVVSTLRLNFHGKVLRIY